MDYTGLQNFTLKKTQRYDPSELIDMTLRSYEWTFFFKSWFAIHRYRRLNFKKWPFLAILGSFRLIIYLFVLAVDCFLICHLKGDYNNFGFYSLESRPFISLLDCS